MPNGKLLKIVSAAVCENPGSKAPGEVFGASKKSFSVACADGAIEVFEVVPEGKGRMRAADLVNGRAVSDGDILGAELSLIHICAVPMRCPSCSDGNLLFMGYGTQRAAAELEELVPGLRVLRMDTDTTRRKFSHEEILDSFRRGDADVLLGTQMVTKGHDFPRVALAGVLNADASLYLDDYRAGERTFAMLTQLIGRDVYKRQAMRRTVRPMKATNA